MTEVSADIASALRTTLASAKVVKENRIVNDTEVTRLVHYLTSPGSGPSPGTSFTDYVQRKLATHPARLSSDQSYVIFSGEAKSGISNYFNAKQYVNDVGGRAGIIGDTPWGRFIQDAWNDDEYKEIARKFDRVLKDSGVKTYGRSVASALDDMLWNSGSADFARNAVLSGQPIRGFLENAPEGRGFHRHELPVLLNSVDTILNGHRLGDGWIDDLNTASRSSLILNRVEAQVAGSASFHSGRFVSLSEFRNRVDLTYGFDGTAHTVFAYTPDQFQQQSIDDMSRAADRESRARAQRAGDLLHRTPVENAQQIATSGAHSRSVKSINALPLNTEAEVAGAPLSTRLLQNEAGYAASARTSRSMGTHAATVAGSVGVIAEGLESMQRANTLGALGNAAGAQSELIHFGSRNLSAWGGAVLGSQIGAAAGIESGPGSFVTAAIGGVAGAVAGEKIANAIDDYRTYQQTDRDGHTWRMDPAHPANGWQRQVVEGAMPGGVHGPHSVSAHTLTAGPELSDELNYKASGVQVQLSLAHPHVPRDPYTQPAHALDTPSLREALWRRDAHSHEWHRQITDGYLEHGMARSHAERASPQRAMALDSAANDVIAHNRAMQPAAIAARYLDAHQRSGWDRFGPPEPAAIHAAQLRSRITMGSDGDTYRRERDGQWMHEGMFGRQSYARGNLRDELDATVPAPALAPPVVKPAVPKSELGDRLTQMLDAADRNDWRAFREHTQAFANMAPARELEAQTIAAVNQQEETQAREAAAQALAAEQALRIDQLQQALDAQQQRQHSRSHGMSR